MCQQYEFVQGKIEKLFNLICVFCRYLIRLCTIVCVYKIKVQKITQPSGRDGGTDQLMFL